MPAPLPHTLALRAQLAIHPDRTVKRLRSLLAKHRSVDVVARSLHVSERTLRRILAEKSIAVPR